MALAGVSRLKRIYLDHNATTPPHPAVVEAMRACLLEGWGNPSSLHALGQDARRRLDRARAQVAALIGADSEEVVFTSGGTEADNHALRLGSRLKGGCRILTSAFEHSAVLDTCRALEAEGFTTARLPVDAEGLLSARSLEPELTEDVALVSVMLANNDLGTLQPVAEIAAMARARGIPVHTDAVQAVGKVPVEVKALGVDLLALSAHKLYGPKGVGALFVRRGLPLAPLLTGGPQERRLRAGTENLPGIVGFGVACELAKHHLAERAHHLRQLRQRLEEGILQTIPGTRLNGHPERRVPNTVNISFRGLTGEDLLLNLDLEGVAVSLGAACQSESRKPSPVLLALGRSETEAKSSLRFSLGEGNTEEEIDLTLAVLKRAVTRLRPEVRPC
jgi:cysteine desulfurase